MRDLLYSKLWLVCGGAFLLAIAYLSLMPSPPQPVSFEGVDKIEHALAYGLLMTWFVQIFERRYHIFILLLFLTFSITIEVLQGASGYRSFDYWDIMANFTGLLLGWICGGTRVALALTEVDKFLKS